MGPSYLIYKIQSYLVTDSNEGKYPLDKNGSIFNVHTKMCSQHFTKVKMYQKSLLCKFLTRTLFSSNDDVIKQKAKWWRKAGVLPLDDSCPVTVALQSASNTGHCNTEWPNGLTVHNPVLQPHFQQESLSSSAWTQLGGAVPISCSVWGHVGLTAQAGSFQRLEWRRVSPLYTAAKLKLASALSRTIQSSNKTTTVQATLSEITN